VYRTVPTHEETPDLAYAHTNWNARADGTIDLARIDIPQGSPTEGMAKFEGGEFTMGSRDVQGSPPHQRTVAAFYLDATEVTFGAYRKLIPHFGEGGREPAPDNWAVTYVTYDAALDYTEKIGKRLPDEAEYEFAATGGGERDFPWNDFQKIKNWPIGPVREPAFDRLDTQPPVYGLYSNVAEWTTTRHYPYPTDHPDVFKYWRDPDLRQKLEGQVVRGGPWSVIFGKQATVDLDMMVAPSPAVLSVGPRSRLSVKRYEAYPGLGFRCARSAEPRFLGK
jgi:formylglycine-generating enzyme required for sulfatase activity